MSKGLYSAMAVIAIAACFTGLQAATHRKLLSEEGGDSTIDMGVGGNETECKHPMRTVILWAAGQDNSTAANYTALAPVRMDPDTNTSYVNVTFMFNVESVAETLYIAAMDFPVNETIDVGNGQYMRVWEVEVEVGANQNQTMCLDVEGEDNGTNDCFPSRNVTLRVLELNGDLVFNSTMTTPVFPEGINVAFYANDIDANMPTTLLTLPVTEDTQTFGDMFLAMSAQDLCHTEPTQVAN